MKDVLDIASLHDHGILLEYQLLLSSRRIDCMVCGRDGQRVDNAVIVELKQWERCEPAEAEKLVNSWLGGSRRDVLHPSVQVGQYRQYLEDTHVAFHEELKPVQLSACSYLHNYLSDSTDPLLAPKFAEVLRNNPLFDSDGAESLATYLRAHLADGNGRPVLKRIEDSPFRPSRKLMDHVATVIGSRSPWILLDEQLVVEPKGRVPRILLEPIESLVGESLDLWREVPIRGPELRRSVMSQRGVVLPAA